LPPSLLPRLGIRRRRAVRPATGYGAPDDLRSFVDTAHELGLAVMLDVVYNHLGRDGAYHAGFAEDFLAPGGKCMQLTATVAQPAPTTAVRDCRYELSDIQTLFITLSIANPAGEAGGVISFAGLGVNGRAPLTQGPFTSRDGEGLAFDFASHTSGGLDIHLPFPNPVITVMLLGGQREVVADTDIEPVSISPCQRALQDFRLF
jgi:hypothetical protein